MQLLVIFCEAAVPSLRNLRTSDRNLQTLSSSYDKLIGGKSGFTKGGFLAQAIHKGMLTILEFNYGSQRDEGSSCAVIEFILLRVLTRTIGKDNRDPKPKISRSLGFSSAKAYGFGLSAAGFS